MAIRQVPHHGAHEKGAEVVGEEDGETQAPSHHSSPLPICHHPGRPLPEELDGTGALQEGHQHADAQLDGTDPDEIGITQGAGQQSGKALETLPQE